MMDKSDAQVVFAKNGPITIGTVTTDTLLDASNCTAFGNEVLLYIKQNPACNLLLNFENVKFLSSAVLTELLRVREASEERHGHVRLCGLNRDVHTVFEITNLDMVFFVQKGENLDDAADRFIRSLSVEAQEKTWAKATKRRR